MDPMSALAMIKAGLSAGKQIHSLGKEIAGFFDSVDDTNKKHQKKKNSIFTSSNEEALDTFMQKERAKDAEEQLKELITQTRGYSAYQELLNLRPEIRLERKELKQGYHDSHSYLWFGSDGCNWRCLPLVHWHDQILTSDDEAA